MKAEAELAGRQRRVRNLDIRPLDAAAQARYTRDWAAVQEQFVDAPQEAVTAAQRLVMTVMSERGYPTEGGDQMLADLSVEHARVLDHYRAAYEISQRAADGMTSTEDLRQAMIHYRALFQDLLGTAPAAEAGPAYGEPVVAGELAQGRRRRQVTASEPMTNGEVATDREPLTDRETRADSEPLTDREVVTDGEPGVDGEAVPGGTATTPRPAAAAAVLSTTQAGADGGATAGTNRIGGYLGPRGRRARPDQGAGCPGPGRWDASP